MLQIKSFVIISFFVCFLIACDANIAVNKEPVFNNFKPESKEYRDKLAEKIKAHQDELVYVFEKYIDDTTIEIIVSGNDFAANCFVKVYNWQGIEGIQQAKGGGYGGAELYGLKLYAQNNRLGAIYIYKKLDFIID